MRASIVTRVILAVVLVSAAALPARAQNTEGGFQPTVGQPGKDVVWVPSPQTLVDKMLAMAKVTPQDYLIDLGSGDGRTVITAAKLGLKAHGIEYNPDMVELAKKNAAAAGVGDRATFAKADIFESDFTKAQVITMFLLPSLNLRLRPTLLTMKPGTRLVSNSFTMEAWQADETATVGDGTEKCETWCTAYLWIVPAKVEGVWTLPAGELTLTQEFQMLSGTLGTTPISSARMRGDEISFTAGGVSYTGKVNGNITSMRGTTSSGASWTANKK